MHQGHLLHSFIKKNSVYTIKDCADMLEISRSRLDKMFTKPILSKMERLALSKLLNLPDDNFNSEVSSPIENTRFTNSLGQKDYYQSVISEISNCENEILVKDCVVRLFAKKNEKERYVSADMLKSESDYFNTIENKVSRARSLKYKRIIECQFKSGYLDVDEKAVFIKDAVTFMEFATYKHVLKCLKLKEQGANNINIYLKNSTFASFPKMILDRHTLISETIIYMETGVKVPDSITVERNCQKESIERFYHQFTDYDSLSSNEECEVNLDIIKFYSYRSLKEVGSNLKFLQETISQFHTYAELKIDLSEVKKRFPECYLKLSETSNSEVIFQCMIKKREELKIMYESLSEKVKLIEDIF